MFGSFDVNRFVEMSMFSGINRCFKGGGGTSSVPTTSPAQQAALKTVMDWAEPYLKSTSAGQTYPGQMVAETPQGFTKAYEEYMGGQYGDISRQTTRDLMSGKPAYSFDAAATTKRWEEEYAKPIMQTWREQVMPTIKESMNMPGGLYSRGTSDYLAQQAGEFYGGRVAPSLYGALEAGETRGFQSAEAAAAQRIAALSIPYQEFGQRAGAAGAFQAQQQAPLSAAYQEYLRQDPYKYAQLMAGIGTTPTMDTIVKQGSTGQGSMIGALGGMALGGLLAAPTGGMSIGMGAALGGAAGGAAGGLFDY